MSHPILRLSRGIDANRPFDLAFMAQDGPTVVGYLKATPAYYIHTLEVHNSPEHPRQVVDAITTFAHGFALHARDHALPGSFAPSEILFHVSPDNAKMRAYVESKGAIAESAILYRLPL